MATVKEINHDSSTTIGDHYDTVTNGAALAVNGASALGGSTYGVEMDWDAGAALSTLEEAFTALTGTDLRFRFRVDFSNVTLAAGVTPFFFVRLKNGVPTDVFQFSFDAPSTSRIDVAISYTSDSSGSVPAFGNTQISKTAAVCIEIRAVRETADGNADGELELFVDGVSIGAPISNIDNFVIWNTGIQETLISFESGDADLTGTMYYDEWILDDDSEANLGCPQSLFSGYDLVLGGGQR